MITIDDLKYCASLKREIEDMTERMEQLRGLLERCTPSYGSEKVQISLRSEKNAEWVEEFNELEAETDMRIMAYTRHVKYVEQAIDELASPEERNILRLRYVDGLIWDEVAKRAFCSEKRCRYIHNGAIEKLLL